jgi:hypothetical protein
VIAKVGTKTRGRQNHRLTPMIRFEQMFRPKRPADSFGEMFEEKILNDDF